MAELVGVSASLVTVGCLTSSLDSAAKAAYKAARHRKELKEEMVFFATTLKSRSDGFTLILKTLAEMEAMPDFDVSSDIAQFLASRNIPEDLSGQAAYLTKEIEKVKPIFRALKSTGSFASSVVSGFRWLWTFKAQLTELIGKTEWLKSDIGFIYYSFLIKRNTLDRVRTQDPILLRRLEVDNKSCKLKLKQLELQLKQHIQHHQSRYHVGPADNIASPSRRTVDSLMELATSMRYHERVPPVSPSSSTSSVIGFSPWPQSTSTSNSGQRSFRARSKRAATSTTRSREPGETLFASFGENAFHNQARNPRSGSSLALRLPKDTSNLDSRARRSPRQDFSTQVRRQSSPRPSSDEQIIYKDILSNEHRAFNLYDGSMEDRGGEVHPLTLSFCLSPEAQGTSPVPATFCRTLPYDFMSHETAKEHGIEVNDIEASSWTWSKLLPASTQYVVGMTPPIRVRESGKGLRGTVAVRTFFQDPEAVTRRLSWMAPTLGQEQLQMETLAGMGVQSRPSSDRWIE